LTTFRRVAGVRRRSAGYWTKAIIEIGIEIEIEKRNLRSLPDNVDILDLAAVARG
jgi:hypothetical protein